MVEKRYTTESQHYNKQDIQWKSAALAIHPHINLQKNRKHIEMEKPEDQLLIAWPPHATQSITGILEGQCDFHILWVTLKTSLKYHPRSNVIVDSEPLGTYSH